MSAKRLFATGLIGTIVAAICCATPVLAIVMGALGLSAWLACADDLVLPALIAFIAVVAYAAWRLRLRER
jgi:mercuric ion transport protein